MALKAAEAKKQGDLLAGKKLGVVTSFFKPEV
jgi:hypothetical protein